MNTVLVFVLQFDFQIHHAQVHKLFRGRATEDVLVGNPDDPFSLARLTNDSFGQGERNEETKVRTRP